MIVEHTYGLEILWEPIDEPPGTKVLGALAPSLKRIVLNDRHLAMFEGFVGPERFTLAHELAHWIYDAEMSGQGTLDFDTPDQTFCYWRESDSIDETTRLRELNANKLAAHLILPDDLVRAANLDQVLANFRDTARHWGVSLTTLRIKLDTLGLLDSGDRQQLGTLGL
ncbi:ImmA/IrrE family metallo-endopeptidase [Iamia majanohamensis]|uniref:ImmA/IrrE family metallo-endopeptidase n=1 Tax=Iamia majanohamensis TaxID=467976 RepID=A0AAE9Y6M4_9ACTN|nr:ImmA/IrrE family metallo-endopeptidase [Iamia majanohamensis]WCO66556.1 ImmA/IrrE family metallo-endopeptidase [Iamia majanohamensis]